MLREGMRNGIYLNGSYNRKLNDEIIKKRIINRGKVDAWGVEAREGNFCLKLLNFGFFFGEIV